MDTLAKKHKKKKHWRYNPWAVCTESTGREDKDKYERCVHHLKKQQSSVVAHLAERLHRIARILKEEEP